MLRNQFTDVTVCPTTEPVGITPGQQTRAGTRGEWSHMFGRGPLHENSKGSYEESFGTQ